MGYFRKTAAILAALAGLVRPQATARYCNAAFGNVCYASYAANANLNFRVAIPDTSSAPFDVLLQISAPAAAGWAGIAWGGTMANNPLTVAWPNGDGAIVSSRWATGHTLPQPYTGATYTPLASSRNSTHWGLSVLCSGCSAWASASLNPTGANNLAWATGSAAVPQPANNASAFGYHSAKGRFALDLGVARVASDVFRRYVMALESGGEEEAEAGEEVPVTTKPVVVTSVTMLTPRPGTATPRVTEQTTIVYSPGTTAPAAPPTAIGGSSITKALSFTTKTVYVTVSAPVPTGDDWDQEDGEDEDEGGAVTLTMGPRPTMSVWLPPIAKWKGKGKWAGKGKGKWRGKGRRPA